MIKNEVIDGKRHIEIRIIGNFSTTTGLVAEIKGVPGLAEETESPIEFIQDSKPWGGKCSYKHG